MALNKKQYLFQYRMRGDSMTNEELVLLYQQGDRQALESLIDNNMGIVRKIANRFNGINKMIEFDDLIQVGTIGLINAAKKYDGAKENSANFITYAFHYIKREILSCVNGRTSKEIGNNKLYNSCASLNISIGDEEGTELLNTIDRHDMSIENIEEQIYLKELRNELEKAMKQVNTLREREILKLHYGWDIDCITAKEIGELLCMEGNAVIQAEFKALRKIRNSVWGRTIGRRYRDEIIGPYDCTYRSVEKKIDFNRYFENKGIDDYAACAN